MTIWQSKLELIKNKWSNQQLSEIAGLYALPHLTSVSVIGDGAEKFLQGQLTCDMDEVSESQYRIGACCTPKGRMVAIFRVFKVENGYQFILEAEIADAFIKHLSKYIPFFPAEIGYTQPTQACFGLSVNLNEISNLADMTNCNLCPFGTAKLMAYSDNRWLLVCSEETLDKYWSEFENRDLIASSNDWQYLDLQQKLASIESSSIEKFLPHEIGLEDMAGVSFTKGCYTGQEIVARMHYLGKLNKHIQLLKSSSTLEIVAGESVVVEINETPTKIGDLVNISTNSSGETLALICIKDKFLEFSEFKVIGKFPTILNII